MIIHFRKSKKQFPQSWAENHELTPSTMEVLQRGHVVCEYDVARLTHQEVKAFKLPKDQEDRLYSIARRIALDLELPRYIKYISNDLFVIVRENFHLNILHMISLQT